MAAFWVVGMLFEMIRRALGLQPKQVKSADGATAKAATPAPPTESGGS